MLTRRASGSAPAAVAALLVLAVAASAPAAGSVLRVERASAGQVSAELSYRETRNPFLRVSDIRLRVRRANRLAFDEKLRTDLSWEVPDRAGGRARSSLYVVDLDADGEPEVFVSGHHAGTGCPYGTWLWRYVSSRTSYVRGRLAGLDLPPRSRSLGTALRDLDTDGAPEFLTFDCRFYAAVVSGSESVLPVRVLHWQPRRMVDVTRDFPARVRADAAAHLRTAETGSEAPGGAYAAYLTDMYLLDQGDAGWQVVLGARRRVELPEESWRGRRYLRELCGQLVRLGYASSRATCPRVAR